MKFMWALLIAALLVSSVCSPIVYFSNDFNNTSPSNEELFFGVTFGGNTTSEAKLLIDKVKGYTNLFIVDNWDIAMNETALNEICEYTTNAKMNIMVSFDLLVM